jgi:type IV pilus assembly protein PilE
MKRFFGIKNMRAYTFKNKPPASLAGFTMVELLVVMAIIGILLSIALPSYSSYIKKARRTEAKATLMQTAQFMQRFYAANDSYQTDRAGNAVFDKIPASFKRTPDGGDAIYALTVAADTSGGNGFTLQMTPVAGAMMADDECGALTLTGTNARGVVVGGAAGAAALRDRCWK